MSIRLPIPLPVPFASTSGASDIQSPKPGRGRRSLRRGRRTSNNSSFHGEVPCGRGPRPASDGHPLHSTPHPPSWSPWGLASRPQRRAPQYFRRFYGNPGGFFEAPPRRGRQAVRPCGARRVRGAKSAPGSLHLMRCRPAGLKLGGNLYSNERVRCYHQESSLGPLCKRRLMPARLAGRVPC